MPEGFKLATSHILLSVQTSLRDASSRETVLDSAPIPSGIEDQGHEIESSAPLDYEVRFFLPFRFLPLSEMCCHPLASARGPINIYRHPSNLSRNLRSSKVPSSRLGRLFHYGANIIRLVSEFSQMRGANLKIGQFMSIQDTHIHSPDVDKIFRRAQDSAHHMPDWQMQQVLQTSLGETRADNFVSFDRMPFATASIGQVHHAVLAPRQCPSGGGGQRRVAVKIQFPNIANSIASDLGYVKMLLTAGSLFPRGLFLDRTIQLADECDYSREASFLKRYGAPECAVQGPMACGRRQHWGYCYPSAASGGPE
ncbi:hypothetical protein M405DRAFT_824237 [Rhizopogon salebrosus TDB-379]|nr:hypothetical protein M405DRAFT_824237 [Rhizopogon salebrosus TDB-379]